MNKQQLAYLESHPLTAADPQPTIPTCQACGMHHWDLQLNAAKFCPDCAAEWAALEAKGFSGRKVLAAFNARSPQRRIESKARMAELYRKDVAA